MLWRKSQRPTKPAARREPVEDGSAADAALDTLAMVLRAFGENAFDLTDVTAAELRESCERWASRILVGDRSGGGGVDEQSRAPGAEGIRRDWGGVRRFFSERRRAEADYVRRGFDDLRETVRAFACCVTSAVVRDREADGSVVEQLARLSAATDGNDTEGLRREAASTVTLVQRAITDRTMRQSSQIEELREHVATLERELREAREQVDLDPVTQLNSGTALERQLERRADLGLLWSAVPALVLVDVDDITTLSHELGPEATDRVLVEIANCLLRAFLRREDFVAHRSPGRFAVIVVEPRYADACLLAEKAHERLRRLSLQHVGQEARVTVSVGIEQLRPGETAAAWMDRAEIAVRAARERGGDAVVAAGPTPKRQPAPKRTTRGGNPSRRPIVSRPPSIRVIE